MSYGIEIRNSSGDVIIDNDNPAYMLSLSDTISGTSIGGGYYIYRFGNELPSEPFVFTKMSVGDFWGSAQDGFVSNQSTREIRVLKQANDLPDPTGYGLVVYNSSGEKVWFANGSVALVNSSTTIAVNGSHTTSSDWVYLTTRLPYFTLPPGLTTGFSLSTGVKRVSLSQYDWSAEASRTGPPLNVGPFPSSCVFANSI